MRKTNLAIICGGKSAEHTVSLLSAKNIINSIDRNSYNIYLLGISNNGDWYLYVNTNIRNTHQTIETIQLPTEHRTPVVLGNKGKLHDINTGKSLCTIDVVFPILHGSYGEDGSIQGLLESYGIAYVGPNICSSAICMDKEYTKRLLRHAAIPVLPYITIDAGSNISYEYATKELNSSNLIIKPASQGSSVGVSRVHSQSDFDIGIDTAMKFDTKLLIEPMISCREIECAVLGSGKNTRVSTAGEISVSNDHYTYEKKYGDQAAVTISIPAKLSSRQMMRAKSLAHEAYHVLQCSGMARVDLFLTEDETRYINEINTIPGFTDTSMYPQLRKHDGIDANQLINVLINDALKQGTALPQ